MTSPDDVDESALVKGLLGLVVGLLAVGVLAGVTYFGFGSSADHSTTGKGERSTVSQQHALPAGTSGR